MVPQEQSTKDERLALAIGKYTLGDYSLEQAADFAEVHEDTIIHALDTGPVFQALAFSNFLRERPLIDLDAIKSASAIANMNIAPVFDSATLNTVLDATSALPESGSSSLERYRKAKSNAQAHIKEENINESVVEDAIEWARTE